MKKWIVLIADIVSSRDVLQRKQLQDNLRHILGEINNTSGSIVSPYTITLGDEFQAVLGSATGLFSDLWAIRGHIYPHRIRTSLAVGSIDTDIDSSSAIGMDGQAFYYARDGLTLMKKSSTSIAISGMRYSENSIINESLRLILNNASSWKRNRYKILEMLLRETSVESIASSLDVSRSAVYKNIRSGNLRLIAGILTKVEAVLNEELSCDE